MGKKVHSARDKAEFKIILNTLEKNNGIQGRCFGELMALWGLRVSDFLAITWEQIEIGFNTGAFEIKEGKTGKSKTITLTPKAVKKLHKLRLLRPSDKFLMQARCGEGRSGRAICRKTAWKWMKDCEQAVINYRRENGQLGKPSLGTHSLRKSGSRLRIQKGSSLEEVQQFLNHSNPSTTVTYLDNNELDLVKTFVLGDDALFDDE